MDAKQIIGLVLAIVTAVAFILYIVWQIKKKGLRQFAVEFIVKAEDMYNHGDNEGKLNYVIDKVIALIPVPFSFFITRETVKAFVQSVFDSIKKALDYVPSK